MKKTMKLGSGVIVAVLFFIIGALTASLWPEPKAAGVPVMEGKDIVRAEEELTDEEKAAAGQETAPEAEEEKEEEEPEEGEKFLEEHLYGQWRFSERLFTLYDSTGVLGGYEFNFSDEGVEALKGMTLTYEQDYVGMGLYGQDSFKNHRDAFLFGIYGGFNSVRHPVYHIVGKVDVDNIRLHVIYIPEGQYVRMPEKEELINVCYNLGYNINIKPSVMGYYAGMRVYIDPSDTETIYVDFCGLWEMKRDPVNYNTNGKHFDGGL